MCRLTGTGDMHCSSPTPSVHPLLPPLQLQLLPRPRTRLPRSPAPFLTVLTWTGWITQILWGGMSVRWSTPGKVNG